MKLQSLKLAFKNRLSQKPDKANFPTEDEKLEAHGIEIQGIYQPLDLAKQQIRLLELVNPTSKDETISCTLHVFDLKDVPPYTALSYRWGDPTPTHDILVNNQSLEIRENLYNFLQEYRSLKDAEAPSRYLWIDQISIEQVNLQERNHQVQLMSSIYRGAQRVLVWLGSRHEKYQGYQLSDARYYDIAKQFNESQDPRYLHFLLENPYFKRLWVAQEIILAKRISVLLGNRWISWAAMCDCMNLRASTGDNWREMERWSRVRTKLEYPLLAMAEASEELTRLTLRECFQRFSYMECSEPRDKVYAMMGIVDSRYALTIDYSKSLKEIYLDIVQIYLKICLDKGNLEGAVGESYLHDLERFAIFMNFTDAESRGLSEMLQGLWNGETFKVLVGKPTLEITMGFDDDGHGESKEARWWYEIQGEKHHFSCRTWHSAC